MRRFFACALALACLLTIPACGGETSGRTADPKNPPPYPPFTAENSTLQCVDGLYIALPMEYSDLLFLDSAFSDAEESWKPLLSVYEKASYESAMEEYGGGGGFLFGFLVMDQAAFEQLMSARGDGIEVFATDGERYYAYTFPTDVQFCRPGLSGGGSLLEHPDWPVWEKLCELGPLVREDFLTRNSLQSFSVQDFLRQRDEDALCLKYYPYFLKDGDTRPYDTLLLRQPARQGEGGIWAVDQWLDAYGNQYLYFPDSGKPAAEYYAELQERCDAGECQDLLTPAGAAAAFVRDSFGHETAEGCFEAIPGVNYAYMERNQRLQEMVLDVMSGETVDGLEFLECLGEAGADNWGVLGRYNYGSDWFAPLMNAAANAAVGEEQQRRDEAILSFLLATQEARTDFQTPLNDVLKRQREADPEVFAAALAAFPEGTFDIEPGTGRISGHVGLRDELQR